MRFIFFKGLENVSVCRCICVHMCTWLCDPQVLPEGKPVGRPTVPRAVQPHRWRGWQRLWHVLQADWPLQHTPLWEPCSPLPILFQERGQQFQVVPALCVAQEPIQGSWSSCSSGAAHAGRAHCPSPVGRQARASQWPEHHSVVLRAQKLLRECFMSCTCYRGVKHEAGMRNALPLIQKDHILHAQCCLGR